MRAVILNCTLKKSPSTSNTEALSKVLIAEFEKQDVKTDIIRVVDHNVMPGVEADMGEGDEWPAIAKKILAADILVIATPTWLGQPSSVTQRALERMDAMISEKGSDGLPVAYNKVGGVVVTGNEDGAHHIIAIVAQALIDIGYTIPGQAWTYWNMGPGPGPDYNETEHRHDWSALTGRNAAHNLIAVAKALKAMPMP
ncbi:MAG: flavodoxin family protein, partial [Chitinophagales bacterium]|nr:flavodoxin family protein [Hyphomicrobiales bacterium]